ncbi:MAG: hypothetical protein A2W33_06440 [Chloroflexi bacterium RBG_16_52_11]|nr:MAG: hypothetical protein A2W33_06440 [Chloroflexi bacterium RBG_16_52_11]
MEIERDERIEFHELGTLVSVTRWIKTHDEGVAEWLKNARRAYQPDRANVEEKHRAVVILLKDSEDDSPARIGLLDVGGVTLEDMGRWSTWQDPDAASRGSVTKEEETQGNGGKAYMYKLFKGAAYILGVHDKKFNRKGFEGSKRTLERGTPGFIPSISAGRDLTVASFQAELQTSLTPYDIKFEELPLKVKNAIRSRDAFTLVEGVDPIDIYKGRINAEDLIQKILRHDQATLAIEQMEIFAFHNGRILAGGKPLELEPIAPYPGFERPIVHEIPEELPDEDGVMQSTTLDGSQPRGRVILYSSRENMPMAYKKLKPRWKITYRSKHQMIGSKPISELVPTTPGSYFVYAVVELSALEPDYVALGRIRPNDGPLMEAVDRFVAEKIRLLAKEISERRRHEQDQHALDEVHEENKKLDDFKNRFLPSGGPTGDGGPGDVGKGPKEKDPKDPPPPRNYGEVPEAIVLNWDPVQTLRIGRGVKLRIDSILRPKVLDRNGWLVPRAKITWHTDDRHVAQIENGESITGTDKGTTEIWAKVKGTSIESPRVLVEVWVVDHVLLTPRSLEIPLGLRKHVIAEVTNTEGYRATNVFLNWEHDADDSLIVRINPSGWIVGNRIGNTSISAGAGDPARGGVWARIRAEVAVVPNPEEIEKGGGFPQLLMTGRDTDPATGETRMGDPDQPTLWQEVTDYQNNIWWLNLESPDAGFFFQRRSEDIRLWRGYHAQKTVEMVVQVHMKEIFTAQGEAERPDLWSRHKYMFEMFQVQYGLSMWEKLQSYVLTGEGLD